MTSRICIDFETRSRVDLLKVGAHRYAQDPSTEILMMAINVEGEPTEIWLPEGTREEWWYSIRDVNLPLATDITIGMHITNDFTQDTLVVAHNVPFERAIWREIMHKRYGFPDIPLERWRCTMARANALALPGSLEDVAIALGLSVQKDKAGSRLMKKWCKPRKHTKHNKSDWHDDPEEFKRLAEYCITDVDTMCQLDKKLPELKGSEQDLWYLDQRINDRGIYVDLEGIANLSAKVEWKNKRLMAEVPGLGFEGITSPKQNKKILALVQEQGIEVESIDAEHLKEILKMDIDPKLRRLLEIRRLTNKTSNSKLGTMANRAQSDSRVRGSLIYHGASTGRWAARGLQVQNYPRTPFKDDDIEKVLDSSVYDIEQEYGGAHDCASKCLRGMLCAAPGHRLIDFDFSNIEGRLAAWIAGEEWKVDAFRDYDAGIGPDIYVLAYSKSFHVAPEEVDDDRRQIGKTQELALQFQGWVGALMGMAEKFGIIFDEDFATEICSLWRKAHPAICASWYRIGDMAIDCIKGAKAQEWRNIKIGMVGDFMRVRLPSGRCISYYKPSIFTKDHYGKEKECIRYHGIHPKKKKWVENMTTHGGDIFQSIVQGTARDSLVFAMHNLEDAGFSPVLHVHDEVLCEEATDRYEEMGQIMSQVPPWAEGLPTAVGGWTGLRSRK